ncbi:hypothetical protein R1T16_17545 [Flavobacterium sp. DG1-102-2]|uniref:hypothetical protein n=1 Tax=Flavobacterium sp. DG1-102-2 TaxID=3081663 RepID=UPI0029493536|nr:hypothetical protein [Flavobacterium sp. DG1-102-2]MDV6170245.1 hypothetical protein [Flavobacterium sp. DG1-102-2]
MTSRNDIKQWFKRYLKPTQQQFWEMLDSYLHKEDEISIENVQNLLNILNAKAEKAQLTGHLTDPNAHAELFEKVYSPYRYTTFTPNTETNEVIIPELIEAELDGVGYQNQMITEGIDFDPATGTLSGYPFTANVKILIFYTKL